jgi:hypothetical protein
MRRHGVILAAATIAICASGTPDIRAQTMSYADAVTKLAGDCGGDIRKLCKGLNLGGGRIADCLQRNSASVSPGCKGSLSNVFQSISRREEAQTAYRQVCRRDMARYCSGVVGDGFVLACLANKEPRVSRNCNQAITDAGWR